MILLGSTCHRVKKCGKIPLGMAKCGNQFVSHTFCGLPHLPKVSCGRLWLATKHPRLRLAGREAGRGGGTLTLTHPGGHGSGRWQGLNRGLIVLFRGNGQGGCRGKGRSFVSSWGLLPLAVAATIWHCASVPLCCASWCRAERCGGRCAALRWAWPSVRPSPVKEREREQCGGICTCAERFAVGAPAGRQMQEQDDGDARPGR